MYSKLYIVFEKDDGRWWSFFLKRGCRHCFLVKPAGNSYIIYGKGAKSFDLFTIKEEKSIIDNIYAIESFNPVKRKGYLFMLNTCVGHIKAILGIKKPFIFTPYQLLKYLRTLK